MSRQLFAIVIVALVASSCCTAFDFGSFRKAGGNAISWDARQIVSSADFPCPQEGFFVHPVNCTRFFRCVDFTGEQVIFSRYLFECPHGQVFITQANVCVPGDRCPSRTDAVMITPMPVIETTASSVVIEEITPKPPVVVAVETEAPVAVVVETEAPVVIPETTIASTVVVETEAPVVAVEPIVPSVPAVEDPCPADGPRYKQNDQYCNMFYACADKTIVYTCNEGTAFSEKSQMCRLTAFDDQLCSGKSVFQITSHGFRDALSWNNVGVFPLDYSPVANSLPFSFINIDDGLPENSFYEPVNSADIGINTQYRYNEKTDGENINPIFTNILQNPEYISPIPSPVIIPDMPMEGFGIVDDTSTFDHANAIREQHARPIPTPVPISNQLSPVEGFDIANLPSLEGLLGQFHYDNSLHVVPFNTDQNDMNSNHILFKDQHDNVYQVVDSADITMNDINEGNIVAAFTPTGHNANFGQNAGYRNQFYGPSLSGMYPYSSPYEGRYTMNPQMAWLYPYLTGQTAQQSYSPLMAAFRGSEFGQHQGMNSGGHNFGMSNMRTAYNPFFYNTIMGASAYNPYSQGHPSILSAYQQPSPMYSPNQPTMKVRYPQMHFNQFASVPTSQYSDMFSDIPSQYKSSLFSFPQSVSPASHFPLTAGANSYESNDMATQMAFNELLKQYYVSQYKNSEVGITPADSHVADDETSSKILSAFGISSLNSRDLHHPELYYDSRMPYEGSEDFLGIYPIEDHELHQFLADPSTMVDENPLAAYQELASRVNNDGVYIAALPEGFPFHYYKK